MADKARVETVVNLAEEGRDRYRGVCYICGWKGPLISNYKTAQGAVFEHLERSLCDMYDIQVITF